jgi:GT2 family glycosyltransferase
MMITAGKATLVSRNKTWSLVIATYNRLDTLCQCLEFATAQSRPPADVVIVDASDNWESHRRMVLGEVAQRAPAGIRWHYEHAHVCSSAGQRNQAMGLATGDVLFLIDDDAFMYPCCADEVMKIYEADVCGCVAGVAPLEADRPPEPLKSAALAAREGTPAVKVALRSLVQWLYSMLEQEADVIRLFLPYDGAYPNHPVPPELAGAAVASTRLFNGFRMTFRAPIIRKVGFDATLKRYAAAEDLDASYRASRHGLLLNAINARIFHRQDASARLTRHTRTLLGLLNLAYLYRRNGYDPARLLGIYRRRVLRRLAFDIVRDTGRKRFSLPCARADLKALLHLREVSRIPIAQIAEWYSALQERIIDLNVR